MMPIAAALAGLYEQVSNYDEARKRLARVRSADSRTSTLLASGKVEITGTRRRGWSSLILLSPATCSAMMKEGLRQQRGAAYLDLNKLDEAL